MTKQQRLVLTIAIAASFVSGLDGFIVNVALPAISKSLGGGLVVQEWTVDAYLITLGSLIMIAGSLSDLFGRKRILSIGLWLFGIASLWCAAAPNGTYLIAARAFQGIAGALLVPSSLAMIMSTFKDEAQGRAIGTWTAWSAVSAVIGPLLGGAIVSVASWRFIFAINVIPIAFTLWCVSRLDIPEKIRENTKVDFLGTALCGLGLAGPVFALIEQPNYGWADPRIWVTLMSGALIFLGFILYEQRAIHPMLPLSLFRIRNFAVGNIATLTIYAGLSMASFLIVIVLQQVGGYSALHAGLAMLPVTVVMFALSSRFGALAGRYGPRRFMTIGPLLGAAGFLLMLRVQPEVNYLTQLLPGVLVFALGLSVTVAPLTSAVLSHIETEHSGVASAVNNAMSRIAGLVAIALTGVITGPHLDIYGFHRALIVVAILMAAGGVVSAIGIRTFKQEVT